MASGFHNNTFQNAGQNGNFSYNAQGTGTPNLLLLMMAFVLLFALLSSEKRYRELLEKVGRG